MRTFIFIMLIFVTGAFAADNTQQKSAWKMTDKEAKLKKQEMMEKYPNAPEHIEKAAEVLPFGPLKWFGKAYANDLKKMREERGAQKAKSKAAEDAIAEMYGIK